MSESKPFDLSALDPDAPATEITAPTTSSPLAENSSDDSGEADSPASPARAVDKNGRPRPKNPGNKTNVEERNYRVLEVAEWIKSGAKKHQCKKQAVAKWGIASRTFEDYFTLAYEQLRIAAKIDFDQELVAAAAFYDNMMHDPDIPCETRLQARINKDKLFGLQRPKRIAMTDSSGDIVDPISDGAVKGLSAAMDRLTVASVAHLSDDQLQKLVMARQVLYATTNPVQGKVDQGEGVVAQDGHSNSH